MEMREITHHTYSGEEDLLRENGESKHCFASIFNEWDTG